MDGCLLGRGLDTFGLSEFSVGEGHPTDGRCTLGAAAVLIFGDYAMVVVIRRGADDVRDNPRDELILEHEA